MEKSFNDENNDLPVLDTRDIADLSGVKTIQNLQKTGNEQDNNFVVDILLPKHNQYRHILLVLLSWIVQL